MLSLTSKIWIWTCAYCTGLSVIWPLPSLASTVKEKLLYSCRKTEKWRRSTWGKDEYPWKLPLWFWFTLFIGNGPQSISFTSNLRGLLLLVWECCLDAARAYTEGQKNLGVFLIILTYVTGHSLRRWLLQTRYSCFTLEVLWDWRSHFCFVLVVFHPCLMLSQETLTRGGKTRKAWSRLLGNMPLRGPEMSNVTQKYLKKKKKNKTSNQSPTKKSVPFSGGGSRRNRVPGHPQLDEKT